MTEVPYSSLPDGAWNWVGAYTFDVDLTLKVQLDKISRYNKSENTWSLSFLSALRHQISI